MSKTRIYTIGREYGSGGKEVGQKLAKALGVKCYDKELLAEAAKDSNYSEAILDSFDEKPMRSMIYSIAMGNMSAFTTGTTMPISMQAFLAQLQTIQKLAEEESCVFIGRCADYALRERDDVVNVFISANEESRIKRISERAGVSLDQAKKDMKMIDKNRASYYNYYTEQKWGAAKHYNLCLDSSLIGIDNCVKMIREFGDLL